MKTIVLFLALFASTLSAAQSKLATAANFSLRAADTAQTCYGFHSNPTFHENWLNTNSCHGVALYNVGFAFGAWAGDRLLIKHNHPKLAKLQWVSAVGAAAGIGYTSTHWRRR